jgi:hypothetical protein
MLYIEMPPNFAIGDHADCYTNHQPVRIHWQSATVLVIEPNDRRVIIHTEISDGGERIFICGRAGEVFR